MSRAMKAKQKVKKKIVKDKVFGCDLMEHLQLSGHEVPQVLKSCTEFVEEHGIVDGIYRLCGISSNVQKLRQEFDLERLPDLNKSPYLQDVHCVSSLCKAYFRELPNPLLTYQLYDKFADAVAIQLEEQRLIKIRDVLKELPLPHYRTLEYLMKHLIHVASFSAQTNMHTRNLAIVWAPNLLRSKDIESSGFNGTAAFMEVRVQSIVVEFILTHVEQLFGIVSGDGNLNSPSATTNWSACVPEDYYRSLSYNLPSMLNHGDGPPQIRPYHTIIEFSDHKRKGSLKAKKWKSIFNLGRSNNDSKRKTTKQDEKDEDKMNLRPAKSMDSLSSVPYTADANDLEQRGLTRRSAKHQVPFRRESLWAESKKDEAGYEFSGAVEQAQPGESHDGDYEEEGQAKSEPTTPKSGRASMVTTPQGRSPKNNRNRAEKCVGVHISGPFSVTLPFHITSNLSRLTRGMECPSLSYSSFHRSSERLFSLDGNLFMGSSDTDKVRLTMMSHIDKENSEPKESTIEEESEQKTETHRMSLEVQDTFSFLDSQDTNLDETKSVCKAAEEKPIERTEEYSAEEKPIERTEEYSAEENPTERIAEYSAEENPTERIAEYSAEENPTERIAEYSADSEMLQYDLQHNIQMEEFSVEPPQDDPCTEDELDQMYFTPAGCLDSEDPLRAWHDSLEDVYLSAYDDLSPLSEKSNDLYGLEEGNTEHGEKEQSKRPKEKERMEEKTSDGPPDTTTDGQEKALCEDNPGKETAESSNAGDVTPGPNLEDKDSVEEKGQEEISVLLKLQDGAIGRKDDMLELEAMLLHLCSPDLLLPEHYSKDIPLVVEFNNKDLDCPEQQELDLYSQEVLLMNQPTVINLDLADVRDLQYHDSDVPLVLDLQYNDGDVPLVQDPQCHGSDVPLVPDPQCHGSDVPLVQDPQCHGSDVPLVQDPQCHGSDAPLVPDPQCHGSDAPLVPDPQCHGSDAPLVPDPQCHGSDVPLVPDPQCHGSDVPLVPDLQCHGSDVPLVPDPQCHGSDVPLVPDPQCHDNDVPLVQDPQCHGSDVPLVPDPQCHGSDAPLVQDPQCHGSDVPLVPDPQCHGSDVPLVQDPQCHGSDVPLVQDPQCHGSDAPLVPDPQCHGSDAPLVPDPQCHGSDVPLVQDPQCHGSDVPLVPDPQCHGSDVPLVPDPQCHGSDVPLVPDPQCHGSDVPLVHEFTLKNLDSPKHHDKDDILLEKNMDPDSEKVRLGLECAEDLNIVEDNLSPKTTENIEEPPCRPSDTPIYNNPQPTAEIVFPETAEDLHQENEASSWEEDGSTIGNQLQDSESSLCDLGSPHEMIQKDGLSDTVTMTLQVYDPVSGTPHHRSHQPQLLNSQISSFKEQQPSNSTKSPARSKSSGSSSMNPDGSVTMKLSVSPNKVQHVKSVPVVPPKPQFAKLPPALKSKFHASSLLSTTRDTPKSSKPDKAVGSEPAESGIDCTPKRRSSWRNATSVSFDTAMALAKDRQQSQNPVRRMQTYCIGDSFDVMDSKMENSPNFPKFTIKAASSRTHRPLSCMSSAEAEFRGNNFLQEDLSIHGAQSQSQQEVYTKEFPQRNRLSIPRIGQQSTDDVHNIHAACHQRRSLL
ncbi:rho GTPase-activating protein 30 isoform X2 [Rana temporaria]|uniref:rho GTPase-activating protein 30 isoform X2 n=1 Tax=Rana temporaria TaxID=8407 RepID=UPI001AAD8E3E|nr:rho GTPase-activating protein 30 isoform X2 [Rana temporaria]